MIRSTIVIPNYNGIKYMEKCLLSLAGEPADIIVVDNGSADGSREVVEQKFPGARCIAWKENRGFCEAVNAGIRESKTPYVILLNNDTEVEKGFVRALEHALDRDDRIFSGAAQMRNLHHRGLIDDAGDYYCALGWAFARGKDRPVDGYQKTCEVFAACGGACIYRKEVLDRIGCLDENHFAYLEDVDLGYRAKIHGYRNCYVPEAVVYHAGSGSTGSRHNKFKVDLTSKNSIYLIYKNMPFLQIVLNLPFLIPGFLIKAVFFTAKGMGATYLRGLLKGVALCNSRQGRAHKAHFHMKNLPAYLRIQWELWRNMIYRVYQPGR